MSQSKRAETDKFLDESFVYDGIVIALIISVANNIYDLSILGLANEFILILIVWYGIVEHFIRSSKTMNIDTRYRLFSMPHFDRQCSEYIHLQSLWHHVHTDNNSSNDHNVAHRL